VAAVRRLGPVAPEFGSWALSRACGGVAALAVACLLAACGQHSAAATASKPAPSSPRAHVVLRSFHSNAIDDTEHYAVALPAGYARSGLRYPVIYALHGLPGSATSYASMPILSWGQDASDAGRPVIVVSPQGARPGDTDPEWHDWGPGRDWDTMVARELVAQVDDHFRTISGRRGRAIIGMSAGGYGASIIGVRHLDVFAAIESWSGYFYPTNRSGSARLYLGSADADDAADVHTYINDVSHLTRDGPTFFGFFVGDADPHFLEPNEQLHRDLLAAKVPHWYAVYPGAHTGSFWAQHEREWIGGAVDALRRAYRRRSSGPARR
jgi:enterochelin esterase-like enzyme